MSLMCCQNLPCGCSGNENKGYIFDYSHNLSYVSRMVDKQWIGITEDLQYNKKT